MCITASVGQGGINHRADAKVIQALLNENLGRLIPYAPLDIDGVPGNHTRAMIGEFQKRVMKITPTSKVEPNSPTLRELRAGMSAGLTIDKLRAIMTNASLHQAERFFNFLVVNMALSQILPGLRMAHFLAQLGHESGDLRYTEEIASGAAYEGRTDLGNTQPGDGVKFKGRGLIQLTGRTNYTNYGNARHRDFVTGTNNLLLSTDANTAVDVSCWFWTQKNLNALADADDLNAITRKVNGGLNGLDDRKAHFQRAKCLLVA